MLTKRPGTNTHAEAGTGTGMAEEGHLLDLVACGELHVLHVVVGAAEVVDGIIALRRHRRMSAKVMTYTLQSDE